MIRLLLVEDQAMVRGALAALLSLEADIEVSAQAVNVTEAKSKLNEHVFDMVLTDIELSGESGLDLALYIKEHFSTLKVIIITTFARAGFLQRAQAAGVKGYLLKDAPAEQLAQAIRQVNQGRTVIDPSLASHLLAEPDPLTEREREVLRLAATGMSTADIAKKIFLSEGTVRNYLSEAISKTGAKNRTDAARLARDKGWL